MSQFTLYGDRSWLGRIEQTPGFLTMSEACR